MPNSRAMGDRRSPSPPAGARPRAAHRAQRTLPASGRGGAPPSHRERQDDHHDARRRSCCLDPELLREELDEAIRARVEQVRPGREEESVEQLERGVEEQHAEHPAHDRHRDDGDPRPREAPPERRPGRESREPSRNTTTRTTAATAATAKKPKNTPRTSRMWPRSRSLRTTTPSRVTSKSGGPTTRSSRISLVTSARSPVVKPVHAAAWARPCSNHTQTGFRNGRIASATMTRAAATPVTRAARAPRRECHQAPMVPVCGPGPSSGRPGDGSRLLEGARLLPPGLDHQVRRRLAS